jgi:polyisoprenoid-binding protein YceI
VSFSSVASAGADYKASTSEIRVDVYHPTKHVIVKSSAVMGSVALGAPLAVGKAIPVSGELSVEVKALGSGNARRDRYMRQSLGISKHPKVIFKPSALTLSKMSAEGGEGTLTGSFTIRGTTKEVSLAVTLKGDATKKPVSVSLKTKIKCSDYKIPPPSLMFVKIKDEMDLTLTVQFN